MSRNLMDMNNMEVEKLKNENHLQTMLFKQMTQELKTPLATIVMLSDIIIKYPDQLDMKSIIKKLVTIQNQALHTSNIINDVELLFKLQSDKIEDDFKETELVAMAAQIVNKMNSTLQSEDILVFETKYKTLNLITNEDLLKESLKCIILNALKFSPTKTKVILKIEKKELDLKISIKDNGIGIPTKDIKLIFNSFFRGSNTTNFQGVGLGLSIAQKMISRIGGDISVQSKIKRGSIFTIHLPVKNITQYTTYKNLESIK